MKVRVYLDTSVFSALLDRRLPDRQAATAEFWSQLEDFDAETSSVTREELEQTPDPALRSKLVDLLERVRVFAVTDNMVDLARRYVDEGVFSQTMFNDALHVAAAVLSRQDVLLSWNFRHLVNRRRRWQINQINVSGGWPTVDIAAPPEV